MNTWIDIFGLVLGYLKSKEVFELRLVSQDCTFDSYNYAEHITVNCSCISLLNETSLDFLREQAELHPRSFTLYWNGSENDIYDVSLLSFLCQNARKMICNARSDKIVNIPADITDYLEEVLLDLACKCNLHINWPRLKNLILHDVTGTITLESLPNLRYLSFTCGGLGIVSVLDAPNLEILYATSDMSRFPKGLGIFPKLKRLSTNISDTTSLQNLPTSLLYLNIIALDGVIETLQRLTNLEELRLICSYEKQLVDVSVLPAIPKLRRLELRYLNTKDLSCLAQCSRLEQLEIHSSQFKDISVIPQNIRKLDISATSVCNIDHLMYLTQLQELCINNTKIGDISALAFCPHLQKLYACNVVVDDLDALLACPKLSILHIGIKTDNIRVLEHNSELKELGLSLTQAISLEPLIELPKLRSVSLTTTAIVEGLLEIDTLPLIGVPYRISGCIHERTVL